MASPYGCDCISLTCVRLGPVHMFPTSGPPSLVKQNPLYLTPLPLCPRAAPVFPNRLRLTPPGTPGRGLFSAVTEKAAGLAGSHDSCSSKKESRSRSKEKKTGKGLTVHISMLGWYVHPTGAGTEIYILGERAQDRGKTYIFLRFALSPVCEARPPKCPPHFAVSC